MYLKFKFTILSLEEKCSIFSRSWEVNILSGATVYTLATVIMQGSVDPISICY
jgi:hypothetical protein